MAQNRNVALLSYLLFMALGTFTAMVNKVTITLKDSITAEIEHKDFDLLKKNSQTIKDMIEDTGSETDLLLSTISESDFDLVLIFLKQQAAHETKEKVNQQFSLEKKTLDELCSLAMAANFLDIPALLDAVLDQIAERISTIIEKKELTKNNQLFDIPLALDLQKLVVKKMMQEADLILFDLSKKNQIQMTPTLLIEKIAFDRMQLATINSKYAAIEAGTGIAYLFDLENQITQKFNLRGSLALINVSSNAQIVTFIRSNGEIRAYDFKEKKSFSDMNINTDIKRLQQNHDYTDGATFLDLASNEQKKAIAIVAGDGTVHVFTLGDKQSYIFDLKDKKLKSKIAYCVSFHPQEDITTVAIGLRDGSVVVWDYIAGTHVTHKPLEALVKKVLFSNDGRILFAGDYTGTLVAYAPKEFKILNTFSLKKSLIAIALSDDGKYLAGVDSDNRCTIIRAETLSPLFRFQLTKQLGIFGISFSPDGNQIFSVQQFHLKKRISPFQQWSLTAFKKIETAILALNFQQLLLFLLVREQGFKIIEKNKTLLEPIYNSLSDEQKKWLAAVKK